MKNLFTAALLLFISTLSFSQIVTYDVPVGGLIGMQLNGGDFCFDSNEQEQSLIGNTWGFTWVSSNSNTPTSVSAEIIFTINDATGPHPTTFNGSPDSPVNPPLISCNGISTNSYPLNPSLYNPMGVNGGVNTFLMDYSASPQDNQIFPNFACSGCFVRVTVDYTQACNDPDVPTITHNPTTICDGATTTLNITGNLNDASKWYIYTGSCGGTLVDSTANSSYVVTPSGPSTTYFIRGEGNCVTPGSCGSEIVNVLPPKTGNVDDTLCADGFVVVNGTTYNSSNPAGTEVFTNVGPNNCDSTVTVDLEFYPVLSGSVNDIICHNDSIVVNGTTYDANNPSGTEIISNAGPYGCDSTVTINLNVLAPIDTSVTNSAPMLTSNENGANYRWLDCNNNFAVIPSETNQSFTATSIGSYAVEITVGTCVDTSACINITTTDINAYKHLTNLIIYPNPTSGILNIGNLVSHCNITLISIEGKVIYKANNISDNITVDFSENSKGIYFLKIEANNQNKVYKIIKY